MKEIILNPLNENRKKQIKFEMEDPLRSTHT